MAKRTRLFPPTTRPINHDGHNCEALHPHQDKENNVLQRLVLTRDGENVRHRNRHVPPRRSQVLEAFASHKGEAEVEYHSKGATEMLPARASDESWFAQCPDRDGRYKAS